MEVEGAPTTSVSAQGADLVRAKRHLFHALVDLLMVLTVGVTAAVWTAHGYDRDAFILIAVAYWGTPWRGRTDAR